MGIVRGLLVVVEAVCALLLIGVILLQKSKSEGLGVAFGSGMGETLFGSRTGNVLTKITITLGIVFLVTTTLLAVLTTGHRERSLIDERVTDTPPPAAAPAPMAPSGLPAQETPATMAPTLMPPPPAPAAGEATPAPVAAAPVAAEPAPAPATP